MSFSKLFTSLLCLFPADTPAVDHSSKHRFKTWRSLPSFIYTYLFCFKTAFLHIIDS